MNLLLIFLGCGLGGVARYGISNGVHLFFARDFPYGTLFVNVSGSFLMGILSAVILGRFVEMGPSLRAFLLIGFLGGYTTFSSFSFETLFLMESGDWVRALLNIGVSLLLCLVATWAGLILGR